MQVLSGLTAAKLSVQVLSGQTAAKMSTVCWCCLAWQLPVQVLSTGTVANEAVCRYVSQENTQVGSSQAVDQRRKFGLESCIMAGPDSDEQLRLTGSSVADGTGMASGSSSKAACGQDSGVKDVDTGVAGSIAGVAGSIAGAAGSIAGVAGSIAGAAGSLAGAADGVAGTVERIAGAADYSVAEAWQRAMGSSEERNGTVVKEGWLKKSPPLDKWASPFKAWEWRWVILRITPQEQLELEYYKDKESSRKDEPKGIIKFGKVDFYEEIIKLCDKKDRKVADIISRHKSENIFSVTSSEGRDFFLICETKEDMESWFDLLQQHLEELGYIKVNTNLSILYFRINTYI
ncbi:GAB4 [Branchiostoma lanceolatum]|uniref:GAB4 protein n=1 Tax=Branchiostoma lanceolatum TaxID=7740 RepID=A0A8S4MN33_BRALA|nr:GAB4 [Branchiostoma lanceolatum]